MAGEYEVKLEIFEGPLDLLLYLIKKEDMSIQDIQVSKITQEYLDYINLMKELNLELAGEFLVMASTLLQIKAKSLLPKDATGLEIDEGPDPQAELMAKLLEYQKFKEAAQFLSKKEFEARDVFYRNQLPTFAEADLSLDATLFDLLDAFKSVLKQAGDEVKELLYEEIPLEQKIRELLDILETRNSMSFYDIFSPGKTRRELIITFLALLELMRLRQVIAKQQEHEGEIMVYRIQDFKNPPESPELN